MQLSNDQQSVRESCGNDYAKRMRMVIDQLSARGITDKRVLAAMGEVPRHLFVPQQSHHDAYSDAPLAIGSGQTISQPYTVAYMCQEAQITPQSNVLEIGTGSGYGAAVLSMLSATVQTIERVEDLAERAGSRLAWLGFTNVSVHCGDGTSGWSDAAPYDAIVVTAGSRSLPLDYVDQLADHGRVIIPIGATPRDQTMYRFTRVGRELRLEPLGKFCFVPLIGENAWDDRLTIE